METATDGRPQHVDVLVVGGGPTGLTAGCLLASYGLDILLVEQNGGTSDEPKAISLDDESLRALQAAGVDAAVYPIVVPGTGTVYYSARGEPLFHARGPRSRRHGHPFKNPFAQPDFEAALAAALRAFPNAATRFETRLVGLQQTMDGVVARLRDSDGATSTVSAGYVIGCDGGRSSVRELLGIAMSGRSFPELWLVADTLEDPHDERYGMHIGDPDRPHVIVAGLDGRCRYEFKLRAGEAEAGPNPPFELVRELVAGYRDLTPDQLERSVVYGFHALLADELQRGRCFLLGDAAHMMPPFAGQGLNSGIRDAMNLAWKLAAVVQGRAAPELLTTYETERRSHLSATIALSVRLGEVVMTSSRWRARLRDILVRGAMRLPAGRRYLTEMRYRPPARLAAGAVSAELETGGIVGLAIPQGSVLLARTNSVVRLDDVLGPSGAVVGVGVEPAAWRGLPRPVAGWETRPIDLALDDRAPRRTSERDSVADVDGTLQSALAQYRGKFLLVRPDRVVAAAFGVSDAPRVLAAFARFLPEHGPSRPHRKVS